MNRIRSRLLVLGLLGVMAAGAAACDYNHDHYRDMIEIVIAMTAGTMAETAMFVVTGTGIAAIGIGIATGTTAVTVIGTGAIVEAAAEMLHSGDREELVLASGVEIVRQNSERSPAVLGIMHWLGAPSFG